VNDLKKVAEPEGLNVNQSDIHPVGTRFEKLAEPDLKFKPIKFD